MRRIFLVLALSAPVAIASAVATADVFTSNRQSESCSKTAVGTAINLSCVSGVRDQPGFAEADASVNASFLNLFADLSVLTLIDSGGGAKATAMYHESVFITGGTGTGVLTGHYYGSAVGNTLGSVRQGTGLESSTTSIYTHNIVLINTFTYNVPFDMYADMTLSAFPYSIEPTPFASGRVQAVDFFDQNGNPVILNIVPEPTTGLLLLMCCLGFGLRIFKAEQKTSLKNGFPHGGLFFLTRFRDSPHCDIRCGTVYPPVAGGSRYALDSFDQSVMFFMALQKNGSREKRRKGPAPRVPKNAIS
jgi:hypothetical protein